MLSIIDIVNDLNLDILFVLYVVVFIVIFIMMYILLKWFMNIMVKGNLKYFFFYCIIVGVFIFIFL